ncbi:MAG: allantoate amidohydrolase [Xanthobacteraceae bacterium]
MSIDLPLAQKTLGRLWDLAAITDEPGQITRTFLSPAMARANAFVEGLTKSIGGQTEIDGWGNLIGHFPGTSASAKTLLLGSHLDTVPNAGKYDGPLGVLVAIAALESLAQRNVRLPFHVDILGFSDEEGTRFHSAYLGSGALAGLLTEADLDQRDAQGVTVREDVAKFQGADKIALPPPRYLPEQLLGYIEVHLEQGPVLQKMDRALGVVDAIAAQSRLAYIIEGKAGHAGTTPMLARRDALAGAAEIILAIERIGLTQTGLVATVGQLKVEPGASNVIPSRVRFSVDIRHAERRIADDACVQLAAAAKEIATHRQLRVSSEMIQRTEGVRCAPHLIEALAQATKSTQDSVPHLISGAGHDGVILSRITPFAMLFVRCRDGLSHHPDEHVELADIAAAIATLTTFLENFA